MNDETFTVKDGTVFNLAYQTKNSPSQIIILYSSDKAAYVAFQEMKKAFQKLHLIK